MFSEKITIQNKSGLHARPASQLTSLCKKYESDIKIISGTNEVNPKSILSVLTAGIKKGTEVVLEITGPDEEAAGKAIVEFINNLAE